MAFYQDMQGKTRQEKQRAAEKRGGFEDEGSRYGRGNGDSKRSGPRPGQGRYEQRPAEGRPPRPGQGRYEQRPAEGRPPRPGQGRYEQRPVGGGFHGVVRQAPRGERPAPDRDAPRDFRKDGNYRFAQGRQDRYSERGAGMTPASYEDSRRARQPEEKRYDQFRYAPPAPPAPREAMDDGYQTDGLLNENLLSGRNPIREALKSGRDIEKLLVARGELSGSAREIVQMAKERHIPVQEVERTRLDAITHNHQGMLAFASAYQYSTVDSMLALAEERGEKPFLVLLDSVTDPHNLGAIIRTAECAGAHGVIVQERRAVGLTPAAVKASAGAVEYLPVARVTNLGNTIESLKQKNIWVFAADMKGDDYAKADFSGPVALVIGAEGEGVGRRVLECCDHTVSIPLKGKLDSLNASVAAGVLMYAVMRAR